MNLLLPHRLAGLAAAAFLLLTALTTDAQAPTWQTAVALGSPAGYDSDVTATTVDTNGNVYFTGGFSGTATFGDTTLTSVGGADLFVAKWNPATGFLWAQ